jgi:glycerol-1-phosphate dehydrogenase [NAD(P)+]
MGENTKPEYEKWQDWSVSEIVEDLMGKSFICPECGKRHTMVTQKLVLRKGLVDSVGEELEGLEISGKCLVVFDKNTYEIAGERLLESLKKYNPSKFVFMRDDLHADSAAIGRLLIAMQEPVDFLVSCGSGTITDTVRFTSFMMGKPFVAFGTAASMDGYASSSSPIMVDGFKTSYPGRAPLGIFADTEILASAPRKMTAAGFGDVLAKIIAVIDWRLAYDVEGEPYCPLIATLVEKAVYECTALSDELAKADPDACGKLMQVLSLTGIAMQMMGTTRPASGAEHQISHLLEMKDVRTGKTGSLHGDKVGIGTLISLYMYYRLFGQFTPSQSLATSSLSLAMPEQRPIMPTEKWKSEIRRVYGSIADEAISRNESEPPQGKKWEDQKLVLQQSMNTYGIDFVKTIPLLLPSYKAMIEAMGGPVYPHQLGYTVSETYDAIAHGKEVRPKFTILRIAERFGHLYDLADEIAKGLPEGKIY